MNTTPRRMFLGVILAALTMALAGCTGDFQINQTEPIRVQVDDDEPETVQVAEDDKEPSRLVVENTEQTETVDVEVKVTPAGEDAVTVLIKIVDEDDEENVLAEEEIRVPGAGGADDEADDNGTGGDQTGENETSEGTGEEGQTIIQDVDVKGKDNFVVVTQAIEGEADVAIRTVSGEGQAQTGDGNETDHEQRSGSKTPGSPY